MKSISRKIVRSFWSCTYVDWTFLAFDRVSGGVLIMWYRRVVEKLKKYVGEYTMVWLFRSV